VIGHGSSLILIAPGERQKLGDANLPVAPARLRGAYHVAAAPVTVNDDDAADSSTGLAVSKEEPLAPTSGISGAPLPKGGSFLNHRASRSASVPYQVTTFSSSQERRRFAPKRP
jgi:hypothetical protein